MTTGTAGGSRCHTGPVPGAAGAARPSRHEEGATVIPTSAQELKLGAQSDLAQATLRRVGSGSRGSPQLPPNPVGPTRTQFWSLGPFIAFLRPVLTILLKAVAASPVFF